MGTIEYVAGFYCDSVLFGLIQVDLKLTEGLVIATFKY